MEQFCVILSQKRKNRSARKNAVLIAEEKAREAYQEYLSLLPVEQLEQHIRQKVKEKSTTENKKEIATWRKLHFTFSEVIGTFVFGIIIFFISLLLSVLVGREISYAVIDDPSPFFVSYIVFVFPTMLVLWIIYHGCIRIFFQPDVLIKDVINKEIHRIKHKRFDKTRLNWEPLE